jgi:Tol biopolymer transport system component
LNRPERNLVLGIASALAITACRDSGGPLVGLDRGGVEPSALSPLVILFESDRYGDEEISAMTATGDQLTRLTNSPGRDFLSAWSRDRTKIAFTSERDGNFEIYVMNADGSGQTNLTNTPGEEAHPS